MVKEVVTKLGKNDTIFQSPSINNNFCRLSAQKKVTLTFIFNLANLNFAILTKIAKYYLLKKQYLWRMICKSSIKV